MLNDRIDVLLVVDDEVDRSLVEATLPATGKVNVAGLIYGFDAGPEIEGSTADMLVVACGSDSQAATELVRRWSLQNPDRPAVALCETVPEYFVQTLFQAGADDVIMLPESPERVLFSLEKAVARHRGREASRRTQQAPMICVLGPKGGTGKTVTASNLALGLAAAGKRPVLVDLDLQFGDVGLVLGLEPRRTVYDLATSGGALDGEKLEAFLVPHETGASALLAPLRPDQASAVTTELMRSVYSLLRTTHDVVVVDTPPDFTPQVITAIDSSSHVCVVGMLDSLSLKNTKLGLETLNLMGYDPGSISLVLNRADSNVGLSREDVEAIVGRKPDVQVPSDRDVPRSVNEGTPIVAGRKRSPVAAAYRDLVELYTGDGTAGQVQAAPASTNGSDGHRRNGGGPAEPRRRRLGLIRGGSA